MRLTDSHCHVTPDSADETLGRARAAGVCGFVVPATNAGDSPGVVRIAEANDDVWCAVGFHPHDAKDCDDVAFAARLRREPELRAALDTWLHGRGVDALDWEQRKHERLLVA